MTYNGPHIVVQFNSYMSL